MRSSTARAKEGSFAHALAEAGGRIYEVGGTIRDRLLGIETKDRDLLVTGLPVDTLTRLLRYHGDVFTVGKTFGVIKFYPKQAGSPPECYDIAIPRKEVSTGTGHRDFQIDYDPHLPVEVDLSRRDFTINAMALEITPVAGSPPALIDPFGGEADLRERTLRMVSEQAFEEDPLRLMRGVQFAARFGLEIDPKTLTAMQGSAPLIRTVSPERVSEEIRKLLSAERPSAGFVWMHKIGILKEVFPELAENVGVEQGNKFHKDDVFRHTMRVLDASRKDPAIPSSGNLELMLAALFHDVGKARTKRIDRAKNRMTFYGHQTVSKRMARARMNTLRMTTIGADPSEVTRLIEHHMFQTKAHFSDRSIRRFINKIGPDLILKLVDLRLADNRGGKYPEGIRGVLKLRKKITAMLEAKAPFGVRDLAIRGTDLMALGIPEGPEIGRILKELVEVVLDEPEKNVKEELLEIVKQKPRKEMTK